MWVKVNIDTKEHAQELATFLQSVSYVKRVEFQDGTDSLGDEDWILPGKYATDSELDQMADSMVKESDGINADIFFNELLNKLNS